MPPPNTFQNSSKWIFGSFNADFAWLYLPGLLAVPVSFLPKENPLYLFSWFLIVVILDVGHVYLTAWRTYLNPAERSRKSFYLFVPILILGFMLLAVQFPTLALTIPTIYFLAQSFHGVRQHFGISKWYQIKNKSFRKRSDYFQYALCALPLLYGMVKVHSRFNPQTFPAAYASFALLALIWAYVAVVIGWALFELKAWRKSRELNRILSVMIPASFYTVLFSSASVYFAVFPLMASHAVTYLGVTHVALVKTRSPLLSNKFLAFLGLLVTFACGTGGYYFGQFARMSPNRIIFTFSVLQMTFFFCHVFIDSFIWRSKHPEAALIYS